MQTTSRNSTSKKSSKDFYSRSVITTNMPVINNHAAGIDLAGASSHFVAVESNGVVECREFGGTTDEVMMIVDYLKDNNVTSVAMESTGVYWKIVCELIERAGIEVYLVNPTHVKNIPGRRKDDRSDACWIQKLHKFGLLSASFRPQFDDRVAQDLYRQRSRLVRISSDEIRRMQKALDVMNIRVHKVISDINSVTGMNIIRAIVAGERDLDVLAGFRNSGCKCSIEELKAALKGNFNTHNVRELQHALERYDLCEKQISEIDTDIEDVMRSLILLADKSIEAEVSKASKQKSKRHEPDFAFIPYLNLLIGKDPTIIPGIGVQSALGLFCELGRDFTKWETEKHFTSYLTLAPVQKISGGKLLSSSTRPGSHPVAKILRQCAASIIQTDCDLSSKYKVLAIRVGKGKALTAIARKIAIQYYYFMKYDTFCVNSYNERNEKIHHEKQVSKVKKMAKKYGLTVVESIPATQ
ncbi:MAG: IS110 family transposase [Candidatus Berkelbacteria bacterium]